MEECRPPSWPLGQPCQDMVPNAGNSFRETAFASTAAVNYSEKPTEQSTPSLWSRVAVDWWLWELAAALVNLGTIAAICSVLFAYDQSPVPQLPHGITLNTVVSFLATIAKSSLMVAVATAISQEKWLWLVKKPRRLNVIDTFEDASRGPFGAFTMLLMRLGSVSAWTAAVVTLCATGFEPFLQQLVTFPQRSVPVSRLTASILTPTRYNESMIGNLGGADLQLSALIGCFGGASGAVPQPVCPGGNCIWPSYHSLALCTKCEDVTHKVSISGERYDVNLTKIIEDRNSQNISKNAQEIYTTTYALPNSRPVEASTRLGLTGSFDQQTMQYTVDYPRRVVWPLNIDGTPNSLWLESWVRETYAGVDGPLLAMGYLDLDLNAAASRLELKQATECSLTPCVRALTSSMAGGKLTSQVTATDYGYVSTSIDGPSPTPGWTAKVNGTDYAVIDLGVNNVQGWAYMLIQSLRVALEGNTTYSTIAYCGSSSSDCSPYPATGFDMTEGPWSSIAQQAIDGANNFTQIVEGVATALTGRFQSLTNSTVKGQVLQTLTFVDVRWVWIVYPLALVLMGICTLLVTIVQTRRAKMPIWKASALPLLYRYVGHQVRGGSGATTGPRQNTLSSLDEYAGSANARLERDGDEPGIWVLRGET